MQKLSNTKLIATVTTLLILLLVAKLIALGAWWYLPSEGVSLKQQNSYQPEYQRVSFANMLISKKVDTTTTSAVESKSAASINSLILKGLYGTRLHGYAILAKKSKPKDTTIVAVGEVFEGYKLIAIALNEVIFTRSGKEYKLSLAEIDPKLLRKVSRVEEPIEDDAPKPVSRADIASYSKNPSSIWKDIGIKEVMNEGKLEGFRVTRVKRGSKMDTLGLQKGDVIIKANNVPFTSLNDVFKIYNNIDKIDALALTIQRNNQEKEIVYEIR